MANTREIKNRIESVQQTRKITNAMYLIASTKLRKARNDLADTRPYFDALRGEIKRIFRTAGDVDSPYFYPPDNNTPLEGSETRRLFKRSFAMRTDEWCIPLSNTCMIHPPNFF